MGVPVPMLSKAQPVQIARVVVGLSLVSMMASNPSLANLLDTDPGISQSSTVGYLCGPPVRKKPASALVPLDLLIALSVDPSIQWHE